MKKNMVIIMAAAAVVSVAITYSYSAEQVRLKGLQFGVELESIQGDVEDLQGRFYSLRALWSEGDITRDGLLESYKEHLEEFARIIPRYDALDPPDAFAGAVGLLKESSISQMESDIHYVEWARTGDGPSRARSDALLQESLDYELLGLSEFYAAKSGTKRYGDEPFSPPQAGLADRVIQAAQSMADRCGSDYTGAELQGCLDSVQEWKKSHLP